MRAVATILAVAAALALGPASASAAAPRRRPPPARPAAAKPVPPPEEKPADKPAPAQASGGAPAGAPSGEVAVGPRGPTRIDFDDRLIQGQTNKSGAVYLFDRKELTVRSMVRQRASFRDEIVKDVLSE